MNMTRLLPIGAVACAAVLGLSTGALAHDPPEGKGERKEVHRVIVIKDGEGKEHARRLEGLPRHRVEALAECTGERSEVDERSDKERTRIVLCSGSASAADRVKRLEEALGRIRKEDHLSAEHRAKVETALEQAIARLRETK